MRTLTRVIPAIFLALAACGGGDDGSTDQTEQPDAEVVPGDVVNVDCAGATIAATISTSGFAFDPESSTISVGEIVHFTPATGHNVVGDGWSVPTSGDECFRFDVEGLQEFSCTIHGFTGTLQVNP